MLKHDAYAVVERGTPSRVPGGPPPRRGAGATGDLAWQVLGSIRPDRIGHRCRLADAFVAISPAVRAELVAGRATDPAKIVDLPNGVPVPDEPWKPRDDPGSLRAAFVGRLAPEKGLDALVDAWAIVAGESFPDARSDAGRRGAGAAPAGSPGRPAGAGGRSEPARRLGRPFGVLRASDLFVLPSREEGMSIALLEAMALGIPSVASAIPGNHRALMTDGDPRPARSARRPPGPGPRDPRPSRRPLDAPGWPRPRGGGWLEHYSIAAVARRHLELFARLVARAADGVISRGSRDLDGGSLAGGAGIVAFVATGRR